MDYQSLKKIWITGASSGIGEALALKLADEGKEVWISARSEDKLNAIAAKHANIHAAVLDITDIDSTQNAAHQVGDYDCAIQCAGAYDPDNTDNFTAENFKKHYEVNVIGTGNWLEIVLKHIKPKQKGRIIIVASVAGYQGLPNALSYGSTKAALINLTESLATELHGSNISVQLVNPGFVKTQLTDKNDFDMPMMISPNEAAKSIIKGMKKTKFEISFPFGFVKPLRIMTSLLPYKLNIPMIKKGTDRGK
jgi:short-subunit dehydrogenase